MFVAQNYDDSAEMMAENFSEVSRGKMDKFMSAAESIAGATLWDLRQGVSASLDASTDDAIYMLTEVMTQEGMSWSDILGAPAPRNGDGEVTESMIVKKKLGNEPTGLDLLPTYNMPGSRMKKDSDNTEMHPRKHLMWMMDQVKDVRLISPASVVEMPVGDNAQFAPFRRLSGAAEIAQETVTSVDEAMDVSAPAVGCRRRYIQCRAAGIHRPPWNGTKRWSTSGGDYNAWSDRFSSGTLRADDPTARSRPEEVPYRPASPMHVGSVFADADAFMWWVVSDVKARILATRSFQVSVDIEIGRSGVEYIFRDPDPSLTDMYLWAVQ